jgi:hypothetical protein
MAFWKRQNYDLKNQWFLEVKVKRDEYVEHRGFLGSETII